MLYGEDLWPDVTFGAFIVDNNSLSRVDTRSVRGLIFPHLSPLDLRRS